MQLDELDPLTHERLAVALFFHRELDKALAEGRHSLALAPSLAEHICTRSYSDLQR